ncbi:MAG: VOC family protein [Gemmatimonadota bacterium]
MITSLYSIAIFVTDIDRAIAFYQGDLGLALIRQGSFGAEFMEGGTHIGVHPAVHPDSSAMVGRHTGMTFQVEGLLDFCEGLHERGVRFLNEPTQQSWGIMAMINDPDGNVLALWENTTAGDPLAGSA